MVYHIEPSLPRGSVRARASKSCAHRQLICAALSQAPSQIYCDGISRDIEATAACLRAMGAEIEIENTVIRVQPISALPKHPVQLCCGESGSTLRFLLPVVGALGLNGVFHMQGRLPERPLAPLDGVLAAHGMTLQKQGNTLSCSGQLLAGDYMVAGNVSSQYISGLLFALPLLGAPSTLTVTGAVESAPYIALTENALAASGICFEKTDNSYRIGGAQQYACAAVSRVEGDWSNAAFWLCAGALTEAGLTVTGLNTASAQGDRAVLDILRAFGAEVCETQAGIHVCGGALKGTRISAAATPDLVPVLAVTACAAEGETHITDAARLRLKESDRLASVASLITALGGSVTELEDGLVIRGSSKNKPLSGGSVCAFGDHRIAMAAAVASFICSGAVEISGAEAVQKSYPDFWQDLEMLTN
ncbi:MAG: 3-phosphoshikimate 1-carboxyvinyltransferase [Oscillospiraceae bacterium]|nr:3-phosphoshikimate 1-carboxyvinyltransferase [Oscillospiraceae bacterium]